MPTPKPTAVYTLLEWHELLGGNYSDLARDIPCSQPYPGMLANGKATPSWKMAKRIEELTGGLVPRTNWFPDDIRPIGEIKVDIEDFNALDALE